MGTRGNYQTPQREAVESYFVTHPEACIDAEELFRQLNANGIRMGKTTVYRALCRLCEQNIVRCYIQDGHSPALYQYNRCTGEHLHIRCERCGVIDHLHCEEVESFCAHLLRHHGFTMDEGKTMLYGLCENCSKELSHEK